MNLGPKQRKVFILGAGASHSAGLPLGNKVPEFLGKVSRDSFAGSRHKHLRSAIERTLTAMTKLGVTTIDQLIKAERDLAEDAKMAMGAAILRQEQTLQPQDLDSYRNFLADIFSGVQQNGLNKTLMASHVRVLTFNYDRVFETAFQKWLSDRGESDNDIRSIYQRLNSGLGDALTCKIKPDRFAFLKLHGGVGTYARNGEGGFAHPIALSAFPLQNELEDSLFFSDDGMRSDDSQIVFPTEKDGISLFDPAPVGTAAFNTYLRAVWHAASGFVREAGEITVIGYSIQEIDKMHFQQLLNRAPHGTPTIVRDISPDPAKRLQELCPNLIVEHWKQEF